MKRAIVIGSNGPNTAAPLKHARADAKRVADCLSKSPCNFEVKVVQPKLNALAVRHLILEEIEECQSADTFLLFLSGHGVLEKGELYFLLETSNVDRFLTTSLSLRDLIVAVQLCKASEKLIILDCCHAGAVSSILGLKGPQEFVLADICIPGESFCILAASGRLERAREVAALKGSFFTHTLVCSISKDWRLADFDQDGAVSIEDFQRFAESEALRWNREHKDEPVPIPQAIGVRKGPFYLRPNPLSNWVPLKIEFPLGIQMVIVPVRVLRHKSVYCLSENLITNRQYQAFLDGSRHREPEGQDLVKRRPLAASWVGPFFPLREERFNDPDKPVVCVDYNDALRFCYWLNIAFRKNELLMSEVQLPHRGLWDYAAFGSTDNSWDPSTWLSLSPQVHHKATSPAPIDKNGARANKIGISDMIGNVWEWCERESNVYAGLGKHYLSLSASPLRRFEYHIRGGGFYDDISQYHPKLTTTLLLDGERTCHTDLGFRVSTVIPLEDLPERVGRELADVEFPWLRLPFHLEDRESWFQI